ncbi:MAG: hypothetical protein H8F28_01045 [Fibrella sp.]|nr:hypothetical protein [Armatimonadota bacterium]
MSRADTAFVAQLTAYRQALGVATLPALLFRTCCYPINKGRSAEPSAERPTY